MYKLYAVRFDSPNWYPNERPLEVIDLGDYSSWGDAIAAENDLITNGPFALDDRWAFRILND